VIRQLGPYHVQGEIARGGAGVVFRAVDPRDGREVAIKVLLQSGGDARGVLRFAREAKALTKMRHPAIVNVFETGVERGHSWIALELIQGESLQHRLDHAGPLAPARAAQLVETLARAVEHAHGLGVLHRDLKPDNVLIASDGQPRLVDFGLARDLEPGEASRLTASGAIVGTPGYWAPEQARGVRATALTDVYGLGAVLYAALTARAPIEAETFAEALIATEQREPDPPSSLRKGLDPALERICLRALAKLPEERFPSARALADELEGWLAGGGRPTRRRRSPGLVAGVAVAGAAVVVGGVAALATRSGPSPVAATTERPPPTATTTATELAPAGTSAEALFERGRTLMKTKAVAEAEELFTQALALDPDHAAALAGRAVARAVLRKRDDALRDVERAADLAPTVAHAWHGIGVARGLLGDPEGSDGALGRALELDPQAHHTWCARAELRWQRGQLDLALGDADRAIELAPALAPYRVIRAYLRHESGKIDDALDDAEEALRLDGDSAGALIVRGSIRRDRGQLDLARADLDRAITLDASSSASFKARARVRAAQRDPGAVDDADRAIALEPSPTTHFIRGHVYLELNQPERALPDLELAVRDRGLPGDLVALGVCHRRLGRPDEAREHLTRATDLDPLNAPALAELAFVLLELRDRVSARRAADRALSVDRESADAWCARGYVRWATGDLRGGREDMDRGLAIGWVWGVHEVRSQLRHEEGDDVGAVEDLTRALERAPRTPAHSYYNRGAFRQAVDQEAALADYDRALELDPRFLLALKARAWIRLVKNMTRGALDDLAIALELDPKNPTLHYYKASAHRRLNELDEALASAARAVELSPSLAHPHVTRGLIFMVRDDLPAARAEFDQAIAKDGEATRAFALRALIRRRQGDVDGALADAEAALVQQPDEPAALTIRGMIRRARGDREGGDADVTRGLELGEAEDADLLRVLREELDRG
jgi:tetratricopeptide (TPR) repeat protein